MRVGSEELRDQILKLTEKARYNVVADNVMFFLPHTTAEDMKVKGEILKTAGQMLSSNKHNMLREHKDECFGRIQEIRQTHDVLSPPTTPDSVW